MQATDEDITRERERSPLSAWRANSPMGTSALINLPAFLEGLKEENPGWKTSVAPRRQQQQFKVEAYGT